MPIPVLKPSLAPSPIETLPPPAVTEPAARPSAAVAPPSHEPSPTTTSATVTPRQPVTLAEVLSVVWFAGALALAVRQVSNWLALRRVLAGARRVTEVRTLARLDRAIQDFRVRRSIALLRHNSDGVPCTFGIARPAILLPTYLLNDNADQTRLDVILVHEIAHIARLDALADRIAQVALMMFWFNPLMWIAARQARTERECAADDAVLAAGARPSDYANDLLSIARGQSTRLLPDALPMAASALERRVHAILDIGIRRGRRSSLSVGLAITLLATMLPVSAARLVARAVPPAARIATLDISASSGEPLAATVPAPAQPIARPAASRVQQRPSVASEYNQTIPTQAPQASPQAVPGPTESNVIVSGMVGQVLTRAQAAWKDSRTKVEIGTASPIDTAAIEATLPKIEQMYLAAQTNTLAPFTETELAAVRARFEVAVRNLDAAQVRFDNGLITTKAMADALLSAATAATAPPPATGSPAATVFTPQNFPGSTAADRNSARALYELLINRDEHLKTFYLSHADVQEVVQILNQMLTSNADGGRPSITANRATNTLLVRANTQTMELVQNIINSVDRPGQGETPMTDAGLIAALKSATALTSDTERANALITLARRNAMTPEMVALYVAAANGIKDESDKARVFAQAIRVKPPGKSPEYYWQR
jgi:beta-lactamase regulating signal transducer with metallopeptidase domain